MHATPRINLNVQTDWRAAFTAGLLLIWFGQKQECFLNSVQVFINWLKSFPSAGPSCYTEWFYGSGQMTSINVSGIEYGMPLWISFQKMMKKKKLKKAAMLLFCVAYLREPAMYMWLFWTAGFWLCADFLCELTDFLLSCSHWTLVISGRMKTFL